MDEIKPALSETEWDGLHVDRTDLLAWGGDVVTTRTPGDRSTLLANEDRHAVAALCLHGQPFGFTREDVDELLWNATWSDPNTPPEWKIQNGARNAVAVAQRLRDLAARIAALLPPE